MFSYYDKNKYKTCAFGFSFSQVRCDAPFAFFLLCPYNGWQIFPTSCIKHFLGYPNPNRIVNKIFSKIPRLIMFERQFATYINQFSMIHIKNLLTALFLFVLIVPTKFIFFSSISCKRGNDEYKLSVHKVFPRRYSYPYFSRSLQVNPWVVDT